MSQPSVTVPVFGSNSQGGAQRSGDNWGDASDQMDFDLLAEYLLDDSPGTSGGISLDILENGGTSGIVSPEQSEDGAMPPIAEQRNSAALQAQQMIAQHVNQQQQYGVQAPQVLLPTMPMNQAPLLPNQNHVANLQPMPSMHSGQQVAPAAPKRRRVDVAPAPVPPVLNDPAAVAAALQGRGRKKTQAQIDRRRERNRILARRTRLRKKFFFESLQKEVVDLQRENAALKEIVRERLAGEDGQKILDECSASENLPDAVLEACGEHVTDMDKQDFNLVQSIQQSQHSFVITDPSLQDNPIVFASDDFLSLTGYSREDVLGRNCRFLQGTETSQDKVREIRKGLENGDDVSVTMINYTADGTPFWNKLFIAALRDAQNNIVNFIGVVVKVPSPEPDDPEYGKALPGEEMDADDIDAEEDQGLGSITSAHTGGHSHNGSMPSAPLIGP